MITRLCIFLVQSHMQLQFKYTHSGPLIKARKLQVVRYWDLKGALRTWILSAKHQYKSSDHSYMVGDLLPPNKESTQ